MKSAMRSVLFGVILVSSVGLAQASTITKSSGSWFSNVVNCLSTR